MPTPLDQLARSLKPFALVRVTVPSVDRSHRSLSLERIRAEIESTLLEVATLDNDLREYLRKFSPDERRILERPEEYRGLATQVAKDVASSWRERLKGVLPE